MTRKLIKILKKKSGRNASGKITVRHQGGGSKRYWREIDFKRNKRNIAARVVALEYDPNRRAEIALLVYQDGEKRYILAPEGLKLGDQLAAGPGAPARPGNALPLAAIPVGTVVHNLEIKPGKGGELVRGAGTGAVLMGKEKNFVVVKLPSGEQRRIEAVCYATIGQVGRADFKTRVWGKAGRKRHLGIRPTVRGVAQNPHSHPHGGGEGRSGIGMPSPKSPWGKPARGQKTRKKRKYSDQYLI